MKHTKYFALAVAAAAVFAFAQIAQGQTEGKLANMSAGAGSVRWDIAVSNGGGTLTITAPDGRAFRKAFRSGASPEINLSDKQLDGLPDGVYTYELQLAPALSSAQKETLMKARGNDDDPEGERAGRKRAAVPLLVQSGSFAIVNGAIIGPGAVEGQRSAAKPAGQTAPSRTAPARVSANTITRLRNHRFSLGAMPDDVIPDDLIVQGSACVGLDCVNGEVFNFDTIRMKENNTRISFHDTSTSAGFPTNDWIIRANSSSSGGASFLAFVDGGTNEDGSEVGTIVFEVDAGAPANSLKVSSSGKVGIRTATPVLDVHVNSSDTPAFRMEQNASGGFTAQTFDIGANEANFFVRDVTGGSRLPFRIRPGAPTSSVDISASGNVGIGTASPGSALDVRAATGAINVQSTTGTNAAYLNFTNASGTDWIGAESNTGGTIITGSTAYDLSIRSISGTSFSSNNGVGVAMRINSSGNVGIGTTAPDQKLSVQGDADKSVGGTSWGVFSDERLKDIKGGYSRGLSAVMGLRPVRFSYKKENPLLLQSDSEIIGFSAQALQKVVPEAVTKSASGYLVVHSDPILWAMLNAIKEQQQQIEQLKGEIEKLQTAHRRRHR